MSKESLSARVPANIRDRIEDFQEREGIEDRSEATRQVLRRGLEADAGTDAAGEQLGRQATAVAGVGTVVAAIATATGAAWATALLVPFGITTFVFSLLWASIRTLSGRDLI